MSPRLRARTSAVICLLAGPMAVDARAQLSAPLPVAFQATPDPLDRSARLQGLGGLIYVIEDEHNEIRLWDFARNPVGLLDDRDSSSLELWGSAQDEVRLHEENLGRTRQSFARGGWGFKGEGWIRSPGSFFYGSTADLVLEQRSAPYDDFMFHKDELTVPSASPTIGGKLKWVKSGAMRWALRAHYSAYEDSREYRLFRSDSFGDYLGGQGLVPVPPNLFEPTSSDITSLGGGGALAYRIGPWADVALSGDFMNEDVELTGEGKRYTLEFTEKRPVAQGGVALIGNMGKTLEWGLDGRLFRSSFEQSYFFTISAGIGGIPVSGRGKRLEETTNGSILRARALVRLPGGWRVGGGGSAVYSREETTPPDLGDVTSYNLFLNHVYRSEPDADSLSLPDSVMARVGRVHAYEIGGGISWEHPRLVVGAEGHATADRRDQNTVTGALFGPKAQGWDARGGLEYRCTSTLAGRAGYVFRSRDADTETGLNETVSHTMTLGAGYHALQASWSVDAGYGVEWLKSDFPDPSQFRGSNQSFLMNLRWAF